MSIKVLVADDSITIQKVISIIFGGDEYSLTIVDNGKAAVEKALEITPDILLIDALMPGMTGYEVAEMVRAVPSIAAKPILILTGSFEPFDEEKAKKCGADDFISKPFESQQIISKVKELLELGSARALSAQTSFQIPTPEPARELPPETAAPKFDIPAPADIWGAFTPNVEPFELPVPPIISATPAAATEPDVFAIVTEENDAHLLQSATVASTSPTHTGSQWVPVEENTFEFEETIAAPPLSNFAEGYTPVQEPSFGDIAFEDDAHSVAAPVLTVPEPAFTVPEEPAFSAPVPTTAMTEEQLRAAIALVSKDVIERIVWEVVPDLAETLIQEAIRKIKEGV